MSLKWSFAINMLLLCCCTSFSEVTLWKEGIFFTNSLHQINLSSLKKKSWMNHYLNNNLWKKRKGSKSRTAGLDRVPELGITYNPSGCIYQFFRGLLQLQLCWSNCSPPFRKGRVIRKATGTPLYSCGFKSSITIFRPSDFSWQYLLVTCHCCFSSSRGSKSNLVLKLLCSTPLVCASFKNLPGVLPVLLAKSALLFSYKQTNENPNSSPHALFKNIIMIICIRRII